MIEFHKTLDDINDATVWDIHLNDRKIGTFRKELFKKVKGVQHGGKCYMNILYRNYVLPFNITQKQVKTIAQGAVDNFTADSIMDKVNASGWNDSRWITLAKAKQSQQGLV
tara:strand:+ start:180 stop:512 length:333 start_codon:yes stop_codon:yes gene_type:complete